MEKWENKVSVLVIENLGVKPDFGRIPSPFVLLNSNRKASVFFSKSYLVQWEWGQTEGKWQYTYVVAFTIHTHRSIFTLKLLDNFLINPPEPANTIRLLCCK